MTRRKQPTLLEQIYKQLEATGRFKVRSDSYIDGSGRWIELRQPKNKKIVTIMFNNAGTHISTVEVHKDIKKIVDQKKIF